MHISVKWHESLNMSSSARVAVLGLGYVGLPLVGSCIAAGHSVIGLDIDPEIVTLLNSGRSHVDDVSPADVVRWLHGGFIATTEPSLIEGADVFVICVPTPLSASGGPDLRAIESATEMIAEALDSSTNPLVVLESTSYPGTTEEVVAPLLEASGKRVAGRDFSLAFSPERIDPGNPQFDIRNTPKIVGGLTPSCTERAAAFYGQFVDQVVAVKGPKEAELAKLLENTYRQVNIALVNELAQISHAMGIDIWGVIEAASSKPYGFQGFRPGPGVGGHCIPIDPKYLGHRVLSQLGVPFRFIELAQEINAGMPAYVVERVAELMASQGSRIQGSSIVLLGVTYKRDIADVRESPAEEVVRELRRQECLVAYHDPYVTEWVVDGTKVPRETDISSATRHADCTILLQDHALYRHSPELILSPLLLDTRGSLKETPEWSRRVWQSL